MSPRPLPPAVPASTLRVYEPAQAFPAEQQARWSGELTRPDAGERATVAERTESWRQLVRGARGRYPVARPGPDGLRGGVAEDEEEDPLADHARVLRVDGSLLLCPATLGGGDSPRRVLVRAWDLPLPWMLVVAMTAAPLPGDVAEAGRYLAPMARARAQSARVLRTLRAALPGTDPTVEVEVLARWLEGFHPRSWLELDARAVVSLLSGDDGMDDVRLGMECLASGDGVGAAAAYQRLRQRSRALTDISRLS